MKKFLSCGFLKQLHQHILRVLTLCFNILVIWNHGANYQITKRWYPDYRILWEKTIPMTIGIYGFLSDYE